MIKSRTLVERWIAPFAWTLLAAIYFYHLSWIMRTAVDVPFWDQWEFLRPDQFPSGFSLKWIFERHNEHYIALSSLQSWIFFKFNHWNVAMEQVWSFLLFGITIRALALFLKRYSRPSFGFPVLPLFLIPTLSPILRENHGWGYQSCFHYSILFLVLGTGLLFRRTQRVVQLSAGVFFLILSSLSLSAGMVGSVVVMAIFILMKGLNAFSHKGTAVEGRDSTLKWVTAASAFGVVILYLNLGYTKPGGHPVPVFPNSMAFWNFFLNLISLGFGYQQSKARIGLLYFILSVTPVVYWMLLQFKKRPEPFTSTAIHSEDFFPLLALLFAVLAVLAAITVGRGGWALEGAKSSRYYEWAMLLVPLSACLWGWVFEQRGMSVKKTTGLFICLWILCCLISLRHFKKQEFERYGAIAQARQAGLKCARNFYAKKNDGNCPDLYPWPVADKLQSAASLGVSFTLGGPRD